MQHGNGEVTERRTAIKKSACTVIVCSLFLLIGSGMICYAFFDLHQIDLQNHQLESNISQMQMRNAAERQKMEQTRQQLLSENEKLKNKSKRLHTYLNHMMSKTSSNDELLSCLRENKRRNKESENLQVQLNEARKNNSLLQQELANEMLAKDNFSEDQQLKISLNQSIPTQMSIPHCPITLYQSEEQQQESESTKLQMQSERLQALERVDSENMNLLSNLTSCLSEKEERKREIRRLQSQLNETQTNITLLEAQLSSLFEGYQRIKESLSQESEYLQLDIIRTQGRNKELQKSHKDLLDDKRFMKERNTSLHSDLVYIHNGINVLQSERLHASELVDSENMDYLSNWTSCLSEKERTNHKVKQLRPQLNGTQDNVTLLEAELSSLFEGYQRIKESLSKENEDLQLDIIRTQGRKKELQKSHKDLLDEKKFMKERNTSLHSYLVYIQNGIKYLPSKRLHASELVDGENMDYLSNWTSCLSEKEQRNHDIKQLQSQLNGTQDNVTLLEAELSSLFEDYQRIKESLSKESEDLQRDINRMQGRKKELHEAHEDLLDKNKQLKGRKTGLYSGLVYIHNSINDRSHTSKLVGSENKNFLSNLTSCLAEKKERKKEVKQLENISAIMGSISSCRSNASLLQSVNNVYREEIHNYGTRLLKLDNANTNLSKEITQLELQKSRMLQLLSFKDAQNRKMRAILRTAKIGRFCNMYTLLCSNCSNGWVQKGSKCYNMQVRMFKWARARSYCLARGGDLVVIKSEEEQLFVTEMVENHHSEFRKEARERDPYALWIGLFDKDSEGTFIWVDGTNLTLSFWSKGSPNNYIPEWEFKRFMEYPQGQDCILISTWNDDALKNWDDSHCTNERCFLCEAKPFIVDRTVIDYS